MNRRNFFKGLLGAVVAGTALTASQEAAAQLFGFNKYAEMVRLQQDVIALNTQARGDTRYVSSNHPLFNEIGQRTDRLLGYAMDNFQGDTTAPEMLAGCKELFNNGAAFDTMSEAGLRSIVEALIPVAVARNLLAVQRVSFNPKGMVNWTRFANKYQDLILAA